MLFCEAGQALDLVEFTAPVPGEGEVLVDIIYCTLCRSDLHTHAGRRHEPVPLVLGHEIVGRIAAFGAGTSRCDARGQQAQVGDRITWSITVGCGNCFFCRHDLPQKCEHLFKFGHTRATVENPSGGGLADCVVLPPRTVWYRLPEELPNRVAAPANCATATVAAVLKAAGNCTNQTVLVLGAGVLGLTACAMARSVGAKHVVACDPQSEPRQRALAFGATHAVCPLEGTAVENGSLSGELAVRMLLAKLTENRGADLVLELSGAATAVKLAMEQARIGGTVVLAGSVSPSGPMQADPETLVRRMLTVRGIHNYHPRDLGTAIDFLSGPGCDYPFDTLVSGEFTLDQAEQAFACAHQHPGTRVAVVP
jgi:alcohol dehydrogenase